MYDKAHSQLLQDGVSNGAEHEVAIFFFCFYNNIRQGKGGGFLGEGAWIKSHTHTRAERVSGGGTPIPGAGGETGLGYLAFTWGVYFLFSPFEERVWAVPKRTWGEDETVLY